MTGGGRCATPSARLEQLARAGPADRGRAARVRGDARDVPAGHLAVLPVARRPGAPVLPGPDAGDSRPGPRRASGRASCATRSARTRTGRCRPSCTSTPTGCSSSRSTAARRTAATARAGASPGAGRRCSAASAWAEGIAYVRAHPEVRDVLVSGGDPLLLVDERLDALLGELRAIPHVEMIRIGTRVPVTLPMRVTEELARLLRRHAPLFVVTHFNHPKELTRGGARGLRAPGRPRRPGGEPVGADAPGQLGRAHHQGAEPRAAPVARPAVLPAPDGRGRGARAPPDAASRPASAILEQLRGHTTRARGAAPRGGPPGRGREGDAPARVRRGAPRARDGLPELPGRAVRVPGARGDGLQLSVRRGLDGATS